ncbi:plasmid replication protein RepC [Ensifer sp. YR511]|uniref:plasmid replication protein RepC n=1 Tax=Ensifer sp. YR511 TaxID=1855294 RepID=UPI00088C860A|nr:plasmid replication protein RepC [Ensifer sp. YR511]SDN97266.1 replication initiation protein RepC [Ensifer sp. YR511]
MKQSGWRKPTPGLCKANLFAEYGERLSISKQQAMLAIRRVAPIIGLKPGELILLDTLVAFTKPCDWELGARPIVWPSNEYLIESTGYSQSAVKRHLRRLAEAGLIAYKDSSNGKRWGRRDDDGRIVEAYGFDLSPLAARAGEFEVLYASIRAERSLIKNLKRKITILRRVVWAMLESEYARLASNLWGSIRQRYDALLEALRCGKGSPAALSGVCEAFGDLKNEAEDALRNAETEKHAEITASNWQTRENSQDMDPTGADCRPHIPTTNDLQIVKCSSIENAPVEGPGDERNRKNSDDRSGMPGHTCEMERDPALIRRADPVSAVTLQSILNVCPAFADMANGIGHVRNWRDFVAVADKIRPIIGISADAWSAAQRAMGPEGAAMAVALITDKFSEGDVTSPGGYLRGLTLKAQKGDLHLGRTVFGRMKARKATFKAIG